MVEKLGYFSFSCPFFVFGLLGHGRGAMMRKREEKERETEMEREKEKEREMERQLGDGKKKDGENLREEQGHCWTRKAVIAAVWYLSTINIFLLLVFG